MSAPVVKLHGKNGVVTINGVTLPVSEWDVTGTTALDDSTDTGDGGYMTQAFGLKQATGTLTTYPTATPPSMTDGQQVQNVVCSNMNGTVSIPMFSCAYADTSQLAITSPVAGMVSYSFDFQSHGSYQFGALPD